MLGKGNRVYAQLCAVEGGSCSRERIECEALVATGVDLGVHFIVSDNGGFTDRVKSSVFLQGLRDQLMAPILQLAGQPSSGQPVGQAYHLRPSRWRAGQGRLIVDADTHTMVQTAFVDVDEVAARFGLSAQETPVD
ncbi:hypothetical protein NGTWS0302_33060 [Mycolicibacterium cyprinidarum]|uniref:Uncharacterized protein n=1 Tax=Mycolicibacterium cyprinidarum TaxID=2860311 RepID=A0ABQ4V4F4_9MYCO|nr:hypothetical protein NGTWS1702_31790 [Mycolicibacterium sp. NGTWSNA01]GJF13139.1 hypothetical protein NGTWS0302_33060 [Mycolicibacterium sp. NGTWS0302]